MNAIFIPLLPLAVVIASILPLQRRTMLTATAVAAWAAFALSVQTSAAVLENGRVVAVPGWIELDGLSALVLLLVTWVVSVAAVFSQGYMQAHEDDDRRVRLYCAHFNLFAFALILVPVVAEPALAWIAIEFTAVFSVLLVGFDNTRAALEAAWKYIALMFMGAAIALLGFLILFWAQQSIGGGHYTCHYTWEGLRALSGQLSPPLIKVAFLLILIGFGTKVGFVPMHTWLPDAHSQAPSPVCAMLSGVKTTAAMYTILRLVPLLPAASGPWIQAFGLLSVGTAAFLLLQVSDYKRLFAYSTIEHMGIVFVAVGLSAPDANVAAMLQMVSHSVTKSYCFFAAGAALLTCHTREIASVRGLLRASPMVGVALLLGALAIGGAPPFTVFVSEFSIFRAAVQGQHYLVTGLLALFIAIAFVGVVSQCSRMVYGPPSPAAETAKPLPAAIPIALILAALPVCLLGLYPIGPFHSLIGLAASSLMPVMPGTPP